MGSAIANHRSLADGLEACTAAERTIVRAEDSHAIRPRRVGKQGVGTGE